MKLIIFVAIVTLTIVISNSLYYYFKNIKSIFCENYDNIKSKQRDQKLKALSL